MGDRKPSEVRHAGPRCLPIRTPDRLHVVLTVNPAAPDLYTCYRCGLVFEARPAERSPWPVKVTPPPGPVPVAGPVGHACCLACTPDSGHHESHDQRSCGGPLA